MSKPIIYD